jgi:hypothetical protein
MGVALLSWLLLSDVRACWSVCLSVCLSECGRVFVCRMCFTCVQVCKCANVIYFVVYRSVSVGVHLRTSVYVCVCPYCLCLQLFLFGYDCHRANVLLIS